jgi:hypothetical protein
MTTIAKNTNNYRLNHTKVMQANIVALNREYWPWHDEFINEDPGVGDFDNPDAVPYLNDAVVFSDNLIAKYYL